MIKKLLIASMVAALVCISGCSLGVQQRETVMRPPRVQGRYHGLQQAFEAAVGDDVILKSPESGEYLSAFVVNDLNGDGQEEALVFYVRREEKTTVRMHVLKYENDEWKSVSDHVGSGSDVKSVRFADMNGDTVPEIIVSWKLYDSKLNKMLTIYEYLPDSEDMAKALATEAFTIMEVLDLDGDGYDDVFLVYLDSSTELPQAFAKKLKMQADGTVIIAGQARLDGNVGSYNEIKTEKVSDDYPLRIYLDANKGEMQMVTEVVYWDSSKQALVAPLLDGNTQANTVSWRSSKIPSMDINNDGIIEIPAHMSMMSEESVPSISNQKAPQYLTRWIQMNSDGTLFEVMRSVVNQQDHYMLILPEDSSGRLTAESTASERRIDFYALEESKEKSDLLFSILAVPVSDWIDDKTVYKGFSKVLNNSGLVIGVNVTQAGVLAGFHYEFLKTNLVAFEGV